MPVRNLTDSRINIHDTNSDIDNDLNFNSDSSSPHFNNHNVDNQNPFLTAEEQRYNNSNNMGSSSSLLNYTKNNNSNMNSNNAINNSNNIDNGFDFENTNNVSNYKGYYSRNVSGINGFNNDSSNRNNNYNNNSSNINNDYDNSNILSSEKLLSSSDSSYPNTKDQNQNSPNYSPNLGNNEILSPPAFDRYPLVSSRGPSSSNLNLNNPSNTFNSTNYSTNYSSSPNFDHTTNLNNDNSSLQSNPFTGEQDFSPFGGYPATAFPLLMDDKEDDDYLHNPNMEEEAMLDRKRFMNDFKHMDRKSFGGLCGILFLFAAAIVIFIVLPAITYTGVIDYGEKSYEVIQLLTDYVYPQLQSIRTTLIDPDTPSSAKTRKAKDGSEWELVFSDEFSAEGRTFYDGDDQYWTAPDIHYDATKDLEWYSPDASTTTNGTLQLRLDAYQNHGLHYRSGMLQSWNKLCFTQGIVEISAQLPNYGRITGLWPGLWTMGNLARPGFLGSTEGVWPYSYDSCDAGITPNQSSPDGISYLPGQRLSVCTCDDEDHPNQGVGRGAPEIDIIEGETDTTIGVGIASQSLQIAPFDIWYIPDYDFIEIYNFTTTTMNTYCGGPFQQAVSAVTTLNTTWYEFGPEAGYFQKYSIEYLNDDDDGYLRWFVGDTPTYTIYATALHPNGNIGWRRLSKEPMSMILNLGISNNWAYIDWAYLFFPVTMSIDYVRIYQPSDAISVTCDPDDYPTYDYIQNHLNVYTNPNITTWSGGNWTVPKNILTGNCKSSKFTLPKNDTSSSEKFAFYE